MSQALDLIRVSSATLSLISLTPKLSDLANLPYLYLFLEEIHVMEGSKSLTVTGKPLIILNISLKSFF